MPISKQYLKNKCKVTFKIPAEKAGNAESASLVGSFNNWDPNAAPMKKLKKDGSFSVQVSLEKDKEYEFRYVLDGEKWANEEEADKQVATVYGDCDNSVIVL